jgi:hypothetical protein
MLTPKVTRLSVLPSAHASGREMPASAIAAANAPRR